MALCAGGMVWGAYKPTDYTMSGFSRCAQYLREVLVVAPKVVEAFGGESQFEHDRQVGENQALAHTRL